MDLFNYFTDEEIEELKHALNSVWDTIAADVISDGEEMNRDEVFEITFDADRPVTLGGIDSSLYEKVMYAPKYIRKQLIVKVFPYKTYGW